MASAATAPGYPDWDGSSPHATGLAMFRAALGQYPDRPLIYHGDQVLTVADVAAQAEAIAAALADNGVRPGDRVAIQLQNVPEYAIGIVAAWRAARQS